MIISVLVVLAVEMIGFYLWFTTQQTRSDRPESLAWTYVQAVPFRLTIESSDSTQKDYIETRNAYLARAVVLFVPAALFVVFCEVLVDAIFPVSVVKAWNTLMHVGVLAGFVLPVGFVVLVAVRATYLAVRLEVARLKRTAEEVRS